MQLTLSWNDRPPDIKISLWNASESFFWAKPIQNSSSSFVLLGRILLPKWNRKSSSKPASVAKWCNFSTGTLLCAWSISSTIASWVERKNWRQVRRPKPNFATAVQQVIATTIPAIPLNTLYLDNISKISQGTTFWYAWEKIHIWMKYEYMAQLAVFHGWE